MTRTRRLPGVDNDVRALFGVAAFRTYAISRVASAIAMSLLQAVILWQVYAISSSTLALGLVGLIGFIAALLSSLIGGAVVDAYDRRVVLLAAQLVPGLGSIVLLAAIATDTVSLGLLYGVVLVSTLAASFEFPARQAILPAVVPARLFTRSLATNSALSSFGSVTGPALGGLLIAFGGIGQAYAAHVLLVVLSTATLVQLRVSSPSVSGRIRLHAIQEGLSFVWTRPVLLSSMVLDMFAVLFGGARALLPVYAVDVLQVSALGYGILSASLEVGTLLMALVLVVLPIPRHTGWVLLGSVAVFGLATIAFGLSTSLALSVVAYAAVGMADQVSMVMRQNIVQLTTPDVLRGRVTAVSSVFISASNELGALESGLIAAATSAVFAVVSGGVACLVVVGVLAWRVPALRRYQTPSEPGAEVHTRESSTGVA